jgi:hypothetical protein
VFDVDEGVEGVVEVEVEADEVFIAFFEEIDVCGWLSGAGVVAMAGAMEDEEDEAVLLSELLLEL